MAVRSARQIASRTLQSAITPVIESLEARRLFAATTIQPLPFTLDFSADRGELLDTDGQGTGFTRVQANRLGTQYNPALIDLDPAAGVLKITTTGNSAAGGNYNGDNTLVNGLETQFNATTSGFAITTRLKGPLGFIDNPSEQAGIMFGPDQDNYVKLVAVAQPAGQFIQFIDEQTTNGVYSHALAGSNLNNTYTDIGPFASINTLDLRLVGDAATGKVTAFYSVNGAAFVKISAELTLSGSKKDAFFSTAGRAGLIAMHKNDLGPMTAVFDKFEITAGTSTVRPYVVASDPANGQTNVARDTSIRNSVYLPNPGAGVDADSLTANTVRLYRTSDGIAVPGNIGTSGGGDVINFSPTILLDANTNYTFVIDGVKDTSGALFQRYQISFTTGTASTPINTNYSFQKVTLNTASGRAYTVVKLGPDGKLYAGTLEGLIQRFTINADGTLGTAENITSLQIAEGGNRFLIGMAFDPASTATNPILWVSHSHYALTNAVNWSGKISKLTGTNLGTVTHVVRNLPRSIRDHSTNQIAFGPDGKLYFTQGSQSAMGAPDNAWGLRPEVLLSGNVLRLDPSKIPAGTVLDAKTEEGGTYNPFATNAPLTIYGRGVRNAYDLLWHSNGRLYVPTNGSAPGGNTPAGGGAPALTDVREVMNDYLFDVVQGGYYGHPNPKLGHYVLNGGNPTSSVDPGEVVSYPVGTIPDASYRGFAYDFGENQSPNGVIEYRSGGSAFGGALDGKILVVQYSVGNDVIALTPGSGGAITGANVNIPGLTSFNDPLDLEVHPANGFIYIVEHGGQKITLARPITPGAKAEVDKPKMVFNDPTTSGSQTQQLTVRNTGTGPLVLGTDAFTLTGADASKWTLTRPALPRTLQPGESVQVAVKFTASAVRIYNATLVVKTSDENTPTINVVLRGLGTSGVGGSNEPSLQRILDLHQIPINTGDNDPLTSVLYDASNPLNTPNDELTIPRFVKAGSGPVTMELLASFGASTGGTAFRVGHYTPGNPTDKTQLFTISSAHEQSVAPVANGATSFDPGAAAFGLYADAPKFGDRSVYSEDVLNTWDPDATNRRKVRVYALKDGNGTIVPNAYVVAFEEAEYHTPDNQDVVYILRNVKPAAAGAEIGVENMDGVPFNDRMIFAKITNPSVTFPNYVKDTGTLRIRNTGTSALTINGLSLNNTGWELVGAPAAPFTIAAKGGFLDLTLRFKATSGTVHNGALTISSNDADEPTTVIQLAGWRQNASENPEPSLQQHVQLLGYGTIITKSGQTLSNSGIVEAVGDEVLSPYWKRADASRSIGVRQLSAYHTQGDTATVRYHTKGSSTTTTLFTHASADGQTFLPRIDGSLAPAVASFSHTGTFGFRIDNEWSDPTRNSSADDGGHHVRFFVAKDRSGNIIPNTYLMVMDYAAINYDYQDNVYLVTNIKPELGPAAPGGLTAASASNGIALDWNDNTEANLRGYNVYRSDAAAGTYAKLNGSVLTQSAYVDTTAPLGVMSYYRVVAVDLNGTESVSATANAAYGSSDTTPPAAPSGLTLTPSTGGILLDWADNTESDIAGYQVWRAASPSGPFTKLNDTLLTNSTFNDTTAPGGQVSYYAVFALDQSGNPSAATNGQATRPTSDGPTQSPYLGSPFAIGATPVIIQAEDFDLGGQGIAYHDTDATSNRGGAYRDEGVDIKPIAGTTNQYRISDAITGEWLEYTVDVATAGTYLMEFRVGNRDPGSTFHVEINGVNITGALGVPDTNSYDVFATVSAPVTLSGGVQVLRFVFDNPGSGGYGAAFDWLKVTQQSVQGPEAPAAPSGLTATPTSSGITLDWADNGEADLAGYNVYRAASAGGTYQKLNTAGLLTSSGFVDGTAPAGATSYYRVVAVNTAGMESAPASTSATRGPTQTPFKGSPFAIGATPITIQAEDFDLGGQGIAYNDTTSSNIGGQYRNEGVDIKTIAGTSGQYRISDAISGEWLEYTTQVAASGTYTIEFRVGNRDAGSTFHLEVNGVNLTGSVSVPDTDGFDAFATVSVAVNLSAGEQVLRFVFDNPATSGYGAAFDWMRVTQQDVAPGVEDTQAPATPGGLTATGTAAGILLDWADNSESDLAGYKLYRSDSLGGTFVLVNTGGLLTASAYDDTSMPAGATRYYKVSAVDTSGNESALSGAVGATRTAVDPQQPKNGTPFAVGTVPVTIQAEDYDLGGQGIAYNDTTSSNIGGKYRTDAVDIKTIAGTTNQYRISDAVSGEWLEYTIDVATAGNYLFEFRVGNRDAGSTFHIEIGGVNVSGVMTVPDTDSFDAFAIISKQIALAAGQQVVRFVFDNPGATGYGAAFDWMRISAA
ncbi:MAG TPA: carbohydrate-binding protein [Tepidisphaeraceae bacterium]|nr:carbohydrate-binding protein [Tepidisphaeraceae bacterium]